MCHFILMSSHVAIWPPQDAGVTPSSAPLKASPLYTYSRHMGQISDVFGAGFWVLMDTSQHTRVYFYIQLKIQ